MESVYTLRDKLKYRIRLQPTMSHRLKCTRNDITGWLYLKPGDRPTNFANAREFFDNAKPDVERKL